MIQWNHHRSLSFFIPPCPSLSHLTRSYPIPSDIWPWYALVSCDISWLSSCGVDLSAVELQSLGRNFWMPTSAGRKLRVKKVTCTKHHNSQNRSLHDMLRFSLSLSPSVCVCTCSHLQCTCTLQVPASLWSERLQTSLQTLSDFTLAPASGSPLNLHFLQPGSVWSHCIASQNPSDHDHHRITIRRRNITKYHGLLMIIIHHNLYIIQSSNISIINVINLCHPGNIPISSEILRLGVHVAQHQAVRQWR